MCHASQMANRLTPADVNNIRCLVKKERKKEKKTLNFGGLEAAWLKIAFSLAGGLLLLLLAHFVSCLEAYFFRPINSNIIISLLNSKEQVFKFEYRWVYKMHPNYEKKRVCGGMPENKNTERGKKY